jgi:hypothetical protein
MVLCVSWLCFAVLIVCADMDDIKMFSLVLRSAVITIRSEIFLSLALWRICVAYYLCNGIYLLLIIFAVVYICYLLSLQWYIFATYYLCNGIYLLLIIFAMVHICYLLSLQ